MVLIQVNGQKIYLDGRLKEQLDRVKKLVRTDDDAVILVAGLEGSGKSVLVQQLGYYVSDGNFVVDDMCLTPMKYYNRVLKKDKYLGVAYDEGLGGMNAKQFMSFVNKKLLDLLSEARQFNLIHFIVLPSFFDLDKTIGLHRANALIRVYRKGMQRGFFAYYSRKRKKSLFIKGKKYYNDLAIKPTFRGRFTGKYLIDEEEYRKKKSNARRAQGWSAKEKNKPNLLLQKAHKQRNLLMVELLNYKKQREIADLCGMHEDSVQHITSKIQKGTKNGVFPREISR